MPTKLLVVDDQPDVLELLGMILTGEGYEVRSATSAQQAVNIITKSLPDLILLDVMLGETSGTTLLGRLKNSPSTARIPVIMLTAKDKDTDVVVALKLGADDYITKPYNSDVLLARIEAVLRRTYGHADDTTNYVTAGPIKLNPQTRQAWLDNGMLELTASEFNILSTLVAREPQPVTREELKQVLPAEETNPKPRIVDVHVAAIRKKLKKHSNLIKTVHGRGYRFRTHLP